MNFKFKKREKKEYFETGIRFIDSWRLK
jgi:hypothetical protein